MDDVRASTGTQTSRRSYLHSKTFSLMADVGSSLKSACTSFTLGQCTAPRKVPPAIGIHAASLGIGSALPPVERRASSGHELDVARRLVGAQNGGGAQNGAVAPSIHASISSVMS